MNTPSQFSSSSFSAFDQPKYLPLQGQPADEALELLLRKGQMLSPPLSRADAKGMMSSMNLEHFPPNSVIAFDAQSEETGRLMMIIAGEASVRIKLASRLATASSPVGQTESKWVSASSGATLGLTHTFSGLSSLFVAQAVTALFVASLSRKSLHRMKQQEPKLAMRFLEMVTLELALIALDHEKRIFALTNVARSMQEHISEESGETSPAPLMGLPNSID
jgi:CRP-like cAMP-binding protein